jgi:conjugative transfer signal peptidase TraF
MLMIICVLVLVLVVWFLVSGYRINTSHSIPIGLYKITHTTELAGHYVLLCPPDTSVFQEARKRGYIHAGFCPGNLGYLMKKVVAMAGDSVSSTPEGITVNNILLPFSKAKAFDGNRNPLPEWRVQNYHLQDGELLLMTDQSEKSFDARYFGLIKKTQIRHVIMPVMVKPLIPTIRNN